MILSPTELQSAAWLKLKEHFEQRLAEHRLCNDKKSLSEADTAYLRGRIAEAKYILSLSELNEPTPHS